MRSFEYASAASVDQAITLLGQDRHAADDGVRPLAGGTDLLTLMKADIAHPSRLVDIKRAELPAGIEETATGLTLGTLVTLAEIEASPAIKQRYPALAEAAGLAATPQLRNMATVGGNLLQRPRCWYFRNALFRCWLKGGDDCPARDGENGLHALFGDSPCVAVHPSDLPSVLMTLQADVRLRGPSGERTLPISAFFALSTDDRRTENVLGPDELVLSIQVPPAAGARSTYLKAMDRKVWAFALVGVAAVVRLADGRIEDAHLVLSGVAPIPWRATAAEQVLIGQVADDALFARAAEAALANAEPLAHNGYKVPLTRNLIHQVLRTLTDGTTTIG